MNSKEEILQKCHRDLEGNICRNYNAEDIWEAMDEYAEEMCKRQIKRCAKAYLEEVEVIHEYDVNVDQAIAEAPLATEEE